VGTEARLGGLGAKDYGMATTERLNEAIARAWADVRTYWAAFRNITTVLKEGESGTTETREVWLLPPFRELGCGRLHFRQSAQEINGHRYTISHQFTGVALTRQTGRVE
jgi:hypothetical protein